MKISKNSFCLTSGFEFKKFFNEEQLNVIKNNFITCAASVKYVYPYNNQSIFTVDISSFKAMMSRISITVNETSPNFDENFTISIYAKGITDPIIELTSGNMDLAESQIISMLK
jgi:hypothetical protein